jgi:hypothetical protein
VNDRALPYIGRDVNKIGGPDGSIPTRRAGTAALVSYEQGNSR